MTPHGVMSSHKPLYGGLILGVNTLYRLFSFKLFPMVGKKLKSTKLMILIPVGRTSQVSRITSHFCPLNCASISKMLRVAWIYMSNLILTCWKQMRHFLSFLGQLAQMLPLTPSMLLCLLWRVSLWLTTSLSTYTVLCITRYS